MARRLLIFAFAFSASLLVVAPASAMRFRRPVDTILSPAISAFYDDDSGTTAKNHNCSSQAVYDNHRGTDFRAAIGTPISAAATGKVYYRFNDCPTYGFIGSTCGGGYGNHIRIDHEGNLADGLGWMTIYGHMQKDTPVAIGPVSCGAFIGKSGSSGNSSGPHLHFEIRKFSYPFNDPFDGACSSIESMWPEENTEMPSTRCTT